LALGHTGGEWKIKGGEPLIHVINVFQGPEGTKKKTSGALKNAKISRKASPQTRVG